MNKHKTFVDYLKHGHALSENYNNEFDITKCKLPESFKIQFINTFQKKGEYISLHEFLEYSFSLYYNCYGYNDAKSIEPFLRTIKHIKGKPTFNRNFTLEVFEETWNKSALHFPAYRANRNNNNIRKYIKDYNMKDFILSIAEHNYELNSEKLLDIELERSKVSVSTLTYFIFACMYKCDYQSIEKIYSSTFKNKNNKLFEILILDDFVVVMRSLLKSKGFELHHDTSSEYEDHMRLLNESEERITMITKDYTKIIDSLKEEISVLKNEISSLQLETKEKDIEIERLKKLNKLYNKNVLVIGDKLNNKKYEEVLSQYGIKSFTFLDSFENHSRITTVALSNDYVFHLTEKSKHNVSNLLKSCNANVIKVDKNTPRALQNAIDNL